MPAALPEAQYSISWDAPVTTDGPDESEYPAPTPSDQISLGQPSASISWDGPAVPTEEPAPGDPEDPPPSPTDIISLTPPTYSISWDGPQPPEPTKKPSPFWPPRPSHRTSTKKTSTQGYVSASISWGKRDDGPSYSISWESAQPPAPTRKPWWWPPARTSTNGFVSASVSWNKRQDDEDPQPTDVPSDPEDPDSPIGFPTGTLPTPSDVVSIQPPQASISWGKRQEDGDPTEVFPPAPTPSDQVTFAPPSATISWGKRDAEAQRPTFGLGWPSFSFGLPPVAPSSAYVSWGKRDDDKKHPTTLVTHKTYPTLTVSHHIPTSAPSACPTVTKTIVPPCVPPTCPHSLVSCKVSEAQKVEIREIEKTIVTITTVGKPSLKPTPTKSTCTTSTVVVDLGCPTYSCVPSGECH